MNVLWAPWRMEYILGPKSGECVFCIPKDTSEDAERFILYRGRRAFVIMNRYPYNNAHLMVTPYKHAGCLTDLSAEEAHECMDLLQACVRILNDAVHPQGINAGLNLGEAAGSGIAAHIHFQIVPRWNGDNSFMSVFSETRVLPEHLRATYDKLKPYFDALGAPDGR